MRKMLDAGCRLAVATDHNPGSSVHQSMPQMMQLCMANGGITLDEAMLAATYNPAVSLGLEGEVGTLQVRLVVLCVVSIDELCMCASDMDGLAVGGSLC